ncbi:protein indeterminate-domain 1 [Iris pallida]|uniref:Protein indeterminate-domain 1 n=1 Tax=Iris pallida TaxID=29817 RepID=A0AAX6F975_IRIPA|nr:protein indeterminate-domain 1 [Iris pallida]
MSMKFMANKSIYFVVASVNRCCWCAVSQCSVGCSIQLSRSASRSSDMNTCDCDEDLYPFPVWSIHGRRSRDELCLSG